MHTKPQDNKFIKLNSSKIYDYLVDTKKLCNILESDNPFDILIKSNLPAFSFELPDVNYAKLKQEVKEILKLRQNFKLSTVKDYPKDGSWEIHWLYTKENYNRNIGSYKDTSGFYLLYDYEEINNLITNYHKKENACFISVLYGNSCIGLHNDPKTNINLRKHRLPISYPSECKFLLEDFGPLDFYKDEIVLFDNNIPHGVYNYSSLPKIDISITLDMQDEILLHSVNNQIRKKIRQILG